MRLFTFSQGFSTEATLFKLIIVFIFLSITAYIALVSSKINKYKIHLEQLSGIIPDNGINYLIDKPLIIAVNDREITIPKGFKTDLASIPRFFYFLFSPNETETVCPAILHDYLYSCGGWVKRKYADDVLHSFLLERGYPKYKSFLFYFTVRIFGGSHFEKRNNKCEFTYIRK